MLKMEDEEGEDAKVLAVPIDRLTGMYSNVSSFRDMPATLLETIAHFLNHTNKKCLRIFDINLRQHFYTKEIIQVLSGKLIYNFIYYNVLPNFLEY